MAITQTIIQDSYSAYNGAHPSIHRMSDGLLVAYLRKQNGSNWDHELYKSSDGGATWSQCLTMLSNTTNAHTVRMVGDKIYIVNAPNAVNTAMLFWRFDYDKLTGTFSAGVAQTTVKSAAANMTFSRGGFDVAPSGRLWIGYCKYNSSDTWYYIGSMYSDNGGTSWSQGLVDTNNVYSQQYYLIDNYRIYVECLEKTVLLLYSGKSISIAPGAPRAHICLHSSDPATGWSSWGISSQTLAGTTLVYTTPAREPSDAAAKTFVLTTVDNHTSPPKLYTRRVVEDSGGLLTANAVTDVSLNSGITAIQYLTAFTDGWRVYYIENGSQTTLRYREMSLTGSAWGSESTFTMSPGTYSYGTFSALERWAAVKASKHALLIGTGSPGSYRTYVLREGIPDATPPFLIDRLFPVKHNLGVSVDRLFPLKTLLVFEGNRTFLILYDIEGMVRFAREFPIKHNLLIEGDRKFPLRIDGSPTTTFDRVFPVRTLTSKAFDRVFPVYYLGYLTWAVDVSGVPADFVTEVAAEADAWVKEQDASGGWV